MIKILVWSFLLFVSLTGRCQQELNVLNIKDFLEIILSNHPVVRQAQLREEEGTSELLRAKGNFDPKISSSYEFKTFKETEYYDKRNTIIKVPTKTPFTPKITLQRNNGSNLNPENIIPEKNNYRQLSPGISMPILQGFIIDERRSDLRQAKAFLSISKAERDNLLNEILKNALSTYWEWYLAYEKYKLLLQSTQIAKGLFDRAVADYRYGELAVVDTIQAKITLETQLSELEMVIFEWENAGLQLSNYLWGASVEPLLLAPEVIPDSLANSFDLPDSNQFDRLIQDLKSRHPKLRKLSGKINQTEILNKWQQEQLKPQLDLSYSFIDAPLSSDGSSNPLKFNDNYKLGMDFYFPIFLRKERGKLQKTKIKLEGYQLDYDLSQLELSNKLKSKYAEALTARNLESRYKIIADGYKRLYEAELLNLDVGESNLFKFNIQINKYLESKIKYLDYKMKFQKNKIELLYEAGILFERIN